ncbi:hypothetical protein ACFX2H_013038 [Malus domestica]
MDSQKSYILVRILSFYVAFGCLNHSLKFFKNVEDKGSTVGNHMIRGHTRSETSQKSVELYKWLVGLEAKANGFSYSYVLVLGVGDRRGIGAHEGFGKWVWRWCQVCTPGVDEVTIVPK